MNGVDPEIAEVAPSGCRAIRSAALASVVSVLAALVLLLGLPSDAWSQPAMPDLRQMSGVPLPVTDVATGTVTVRVVRGSLANVVTGQEVQLTVGSAARSGQTNSAGRAEFTGLTPGTRVKATTTVDGERLESQEFPVPAAGGVRLMLVAAAAAGSPAAGAAPERTAQPGTVVLGDQTRFVFEMGDDALTGFYILQIVNGAAGPVQPPTAVALKLPEGTQGATMMQGSSPQGTVAGSTVSVAGPFAPGQTQVQVAFTLPYSSGDLTIEQPLPLPLAQVTLLVEKVGAMQLESPQIAQHRDIKAEGDTYILGQGPGVAAGGALSLHVSGLPHRAVWPRNVALTLAALILVAGIWASVRPGRAAEAERTRVEKLRARRDRLFAELAGIEEQRRAAGSADDGGRYQTRRGELVSALERVYAELDEEAAA